MAAPVRITTRANARTKRDEPPEEIHFLIAASDKWSYPDGGRYAFISYEKKEDNAARLIAVIGFRHFAIYPCDLPWETLPLQAAVRSSSFISSCAVDEHALPYPIADRPDPHEIRSPIIKCHVVRSAYTFKVLRVFVLPEICRSDLIVV